jgi:hypothetical protein
LRGGWDWIIASRKNLARTLAEEDRREDRIMATVTLPKGRTAILIMDCQNDIVHENGKMNAAMKGALAKAIKERNVLGTIARLAAAGRSAGVPIIHVRHAYRPD